MLVVTKFAHAPCSSVDGDLFGNIFESLYDLNQAFHAKSRTVVRVLLSFEKTIHLIVVEQFVFICCSSIISVSKYFACICK